MREAFSPTRAFNLVAMKEEPRLCPSSFSAKKRMIRFLGSKLNSLMIRPRVIDLGQQWNEEIHGVLDRT